VGTREPSLPATARLQPLALELIYAPRSRGLIAERSLDEMRARARSPRAAPGAGWPHERLFPDVEAEGDRITGVHRPAHRRASTSTAAAGEFADADFARVLRHLAGRRTSEPAAARALLGSAP
jgi:hypothetical protein